MVTFKNLSGSLGVTYSQWTTYPGEASWINNLKIEFNNKTNWYYGQNPGQISFMQYDFETVALHELGHCFQLRHDGDPNEIMYPTTSNGQTKRKITPNALNGALKMKSSATNISGIHYNPMQWLDLSTETNVVIKLLGGATAVVCNLEPHVRIPHVSDLPLSAEGTSQNATVLGVAVVADWASTVLKSLDHFA